MFTLYRIGFCAGTKSLPVWCEQTPRETAQTVHTGSICALTNYSILNSFIYFRNDSVHTIQLKRHEKLSDTTCTFFNIGAVLRRDRYCAGTGVLCLNGRYIPIFIVWTEAARNGTSSSPANCTGTSVLRANWPTRYGFRAGTKPMRYMVWTPSCFTENPSCWERLACLLWASYREDKSHDKRGKVTECCHNVWIMIS